MHTGKWITLHKSVVYNTVLIRYARGLCCAQLPFLQMLKIKGFQFHFISDCASYALHNGIPSASLEASDEQFTWHTPPITLDSSLGF